VWCFFAAVSGGRGWRVGREGCGEGVWGLRLRLWEGRERAGGGRCEKGSGEDVEVGDRAGVDVGMDRSGG
jgi:hypothetical protein